ncbi:MAG TPA: NUDIX hydrolase [Pseudoclavibacter sp.]|nr:NUDIX hydrolase [Pseudoclavibacter sp.]
MTVYAAGALCWRISPTGVQVLAVYRKRHKDVSYPKGKLDPGEILPVTAVREVREETGLSITLGPKLDTVHYELPNGSDKEVHYWASFIPEDTAQGLLRSFTPNSEVQRLLWLSIPEAREQLSYEHDLDPLTTLERLITQTTEPAQTAIILRHGKALSRSSWGKSEATRPLASKGTHQAKALVTALAPWRPRVLISSPWERCLRTIRPYAESADRPVATRDKLTEASCMAHPKKTRALVQQLIRKGKSIVFCTHRPVFPEIVTAVSELLADPDSLDSSAIVGLDTGSFVALSLGGNAEDEHRLLLSQETVHPLGA